MGMGEGDGAGAGGRVGAGFEAGEPSEFGAVK